MKKQEFLHELRNYLKVLQDEEQEDILDEYSQHIEMKIENGLSEEEAIKDFGSIPELAGEILEAYHVKPEYEKEERKKSRKKMWKKISLPDFSSAGFYAAGVGRKIWDKIKSFFCLCIMPFQKIGQMIKRKMIKRKTQKKEGKRMDTKKMAVLPFIAEKTGKLIDGIFACFFWCCRIFWNCGILFLSAFSAFFGLIALFCLGALLVLWMQGYPLGGVVVGVIGAVFCFGSFSVLGSTFVIRKPRPVYRTEKTEEKLEEQKDMQWEIRKNAVNHAQNGREDEG